MIPLTKIIAAILVVLAIAVGGYAWMLSRQPAPAPVAAGQSPSSQAAPAKLFPVVVTTKAVPAGETLTADALRVAQLPMKPGNSFSDAAPLAGRAAIVDLAEGTPLQEGQLVSGLALRVNPGERAVAIKADEAMGVGNRVQPGDYVDVFVTFKTDGREVENSQSRLLLSRKRVLAFGVTSVDGSPTKNPDGSKAASSNAGNTSGATSTARGERLEPARTAVLAVPVEDINKLALGDNGGRLTLALRNPGDMAEPDPKLFAEIPTALRLAALRPGETRKPLDGLDKAAGGLTVADLANAATSSTPSRIPGMNGPTAVAARGAVAAPRTGSAASRAPRAGSLDVEVIRGDKREVVTY